MKMIESAAEEDDSQDVVLGPPAADRVPFGPLKAIIESIAGRVNYGIDATDLPGGLPEGAEGVPAGLQLWRWEVKDEALLPKELRSKLDKRKAERVQVSTNTPPINHLIDQLTRSCALTRSKPTLSPSSLP